MCGEVNLTHPPLSYVNFENNMTQSKFACDARVVHIDHGRASVRFCTFPHIVVVYDSATYCRVMSEPRNDPTVAACRVHFALNRLYNTSQATSDLRTRALSHLTCMHASPCRVHAECPGRVAQQRRTRTDGVKVDAQQVSKTSLLYSMPVRCLPVT